MKISRLIVREISYRGGNFIMGAISIAVAAGVLIGAIAVLRLHDLSTAQILKEKEQELAERVSSLNDEVRRAMLKLGFNLVILPADQNLGDWYADDYATKYMPEDYVSKLANSGIVTVRHFLPSLQQKVMWTEKKRTIILVGTRGEVANMHKNRLKPLVQPVEGDQIVLGYELHNSMGYKIGDKLTLLGREFTVHKCHSERGSKDDITAWIALDAAQELLDRKGQINAILALQCNCPNSELHKIRAEVSKILPDTQVIEMASKAVARAETREQVKVDGKRAIEQEAQARERLRAEREQLARLLVPVIMVASVLLVGLLAVSNVRDRIAEIAVLRTLGVKALAIFGVFLTRAALTGFTGGILGAAAGWLMSLQLGVGVETRVMVSVLLFAPLLSVVAGWLPALMAAQQDPADILRLE